MMMVREKMNDLNLEFYNNLEVDPFKLLAQVGGFHTYNDLEIIYPYIKNARTILEIGAGYGRCIDFLLHKNYQGKIIAVEQSPKLAAHMMSRFTGIAEILQINIKTLSLKDEVDAALWMWSGLIDFSNEEQEETIIKIGSNLSEGGRLAIDIPKTGFKTIGDHQGEKNIIFESSYGTLHCFLPDESDLSGYAAQAGLHIIFRKNYYTSTEKQRTMYILEKK